MLCAQQTRMHRRLHRHYVVAILYQGNSSFSVATTATKHSAGKESAHLTALERIYDSKVESLASARAEKARVDALNKSIEATVEHYRKAIANERRRLLREAAKRARESSSDSGPDAPPQPVLAAVAGADAEFAPLAIADRDPLDAPLVPPAVAAAAGRWEPHGVSWADLAQEHKRLRRTPFPDGAGCAGKRRGAPCTDAQGLTRVTPQLLRKWPEAWGRDKVCIDPYPIVCKCCDTSLRRRG